MKLSIPRIKIEVEHADEASLNASTVTLALGFALHLTWVFLTAFNTSELFWPAVDIDGADTAYYSVSAYVLTGIMLVYGLFYQKLRSTLFGSTRARRRMRFIGMVLMVGGTTLLFSVADVSSPTTVAGCSGAVTGVGSAIVLMSFAVSTSDCDVATIVLVSSVGIAGAFVISTGVLYLNSIVPCGFIITAVIPLFEYLCLYCCSSTLVDKLRFSTITRYVNQQAYTLHTGSSFFMCGICVGCIRTMAFREFALVEDNYACLTAGMVGGVLGCIILFSVLARRNRYVVSANVIAIPWAVAVFAIALFIPNLSPLWRGGCFVFSYVVAMGGIWVSMAAAAQAFRISMFLTFGVGLFAVMAGEMCVAPLGPIGGPIINSLQSQESLAVLSLAAGVIGSNHMPSREELIRMLGLEITHETLTSLKDTVKDNDDAIMLDEEVFDRPEDAGKDAATDKTADNIQGDTTSPATHVNNTQDADDTSLPILEAAQQAEAEHEAAVKQGAFTRACETIANRYLLSKRELEVLYLLAKGRNARVVQQELFISSGTVHTHMRHIYRKLDVHSQQELMNLVDEEKRQQHKEDW